jgi:endonuclease IV
MNENEKLVIDISSAVLKDPQSAGWLSAAEERAAASGAVLGIQVHNSASEDDLEKALKSSLPLSFHAPVLGRYMINLAAEDCTESWKLIDEQVRLMRQCNVSRAVFHSALMTDKPIFAFGHGMSYSECMQAAARPELQRGDGSIFIRNYTAESEYIMRMARLKNNLELLQKKYPDILWCVENDFPAFVALVLSGKDLAGLRHAACFDTGHMWAACKMLEMDFYEEMFKAMSSGNVKMIHLHASRYTFDMPHSEWGDGHLNLNHPTAMDIPRIIRSCRKYGVKHIVLEIATAQLEDVETVLKYYFEEQP